MRSQDAFVKGEVSFGHIHRINADGTNQVQLRFGERGESSPRWSPDGNRSRLCLGAGAGRGNEGKRPSRMTRPGQVY